MADVPHPPKIDYPPSIDWEGVNESLGMLPAKTEPLDEKLYRYGDFGLAPLKTEGEPLPYDPLAGPGVPLTPWQLRVQRLRVVLQRIRDLPDRLQWAFIGGADYRYDDGDW